MLKLLKLYIGYYVNETRDTREMLAAKEAGYDIEILCFGKEDQVYDKAKKKLYKEVDENGFVINRFYGDELLKQWNWKACIVWIKHIRNIKPDVISGHDLEATFIGYLYKLLIIKKRNIKLVYDAHEFEPGRNVIRTKWETHLIIILEQFIMKHCNLNIVVNDSIADELKNMYKLKKRPLVIRSIPPYWKLNQVIIANKRKEVINLLNVDADAFIIMYHGGIMPNRGIERLIEVVSREEGLCLVIMGYALDYNYMQRIKRLIKKKKVAEKILILPPVLPNLIWEYVGASNCVVHVLNGAIKNHYLSLPNKFFESIQSLTPLITSNYPEMKKLINLYDIGLTCDPNNSSEIIESIKLMRDNEVMYKKFKDNLQVAKKELCWENEKKALIREYKKLFTTKSN